MTNSQTQHSPELTHWFNAEKARVLRRFETREDRRTLARLPRRVVIGGTR